MKDKIELNQKIITCISENSEKLDILTNETTKLNSLCTQSAFENLARVEHVKISQLYTSILETKKVIESARVALIEQNQKLAALLELVKIGSENTSLH
jgi:hypothetical protein